ncbi:MAG: lysine-2,3-aminomutase-like protein [Pseudomonadota bacterium]
MKAKIKPSLQSKKLDEIKSYGGDSHSALLDKYAYRITGTIRKSIKGNIKTDAVAKQYIPQSQELKILPSENPDPIGDDAHSPIKGIVHRYPDRVLFKPANICAVYCRYCFRREMVGPQNSDILNAKEREAALDYIREHNEIWEVILTGGDPLVLSARQLKDIIEALNDIEHVRIIRVHTRVPIADPRRINAELLDALKSEKPIYIALHVNHAQELIEETRAALKALHSQGIHMLSQSVLLKGVNNKSETLAELYRELVSLNVKPYYLHHPDLAPGTSHFRLSIEEGQKIMQELRGHLSGLCQPTYMLDIPGGAGKVTLTPEALEKLEDGYRITDYKNCTHIYREQS